MRAILLYGLMAPLLGLPASMVKAGTPGGAAPAQVLEAELGRAPVEGAIRRPYTFTLMRSGGFAGVQDELVVDSATMQLAYQSWPHEPVTARATEADLRALEQTLENADFMRINAPYRCPNCNDQFIYDASLEMQGVEEHKVHWEDGSKAPAELLAIEDLWQRWIEEHSSSQ